jgi:putative transposase
MARLVRVSPVDIPQHIIQRGNNRQVCFGNEEDMKAYLNWLKVFSKKHQVSVHAWVLMTNHVHLICTPQKESAISRMMQSVGHMYVQYYNRSYQRSGTLWEGRFKSSLVQSERYLLDLYRYVELNPVRAGMVEEPSAYSWSSYSINALGVKSDLQTPHPEYLALGRTKDERYCNYRELFKTHIETKLLKEIRDNINKGLALGNKRFTTQIEALTNRRVTAKKAGRPRKRKDNINNNNQLMLL